MRRCLALLCALLVYQAGANSVLTGYGELRAAAGDAALLPRDLSQCGRTAEGWLSRQLALPPPAPLDNPDDLLYFLHVPRTAGECNLSTS
jgi:hypothetical protein